MSCFLEVYWGNPNCPIRISSICGSYQTFRKTFHKDIPYGLTLINEILVFLLQVDHFQSNKSFIWILLRLREILSSEFQTEFQTTTKRFREL